MLLSAGTFEHPHEDAGWLVASANLSWERSQEQAHSGLWSAKLTRLNTVGPFQLFETNAGTANNPVTPGDVPTLRFAMLSLTTAHATRARWRYYDVNRASLGDQVAEGPNLVVGEWTLVEVTGPPAPAGAVWINPCPNTSNNADVGEIVYVDDVSMTLDIR